MLEFSTGSLPGDHTYGTVSGACPEGYFISAWFMNSMKASGSGPQPVEIVTIEPTVLHPQYNLPVEMKLKVFTEFSGSWVLTLKIICTLLGP